jgi:hypothetical protein
VEKMTPVESIPGMGGRSDKRESWRESIQEWYIWYFERTTVYIFCKCHLLSTIMTKRQYPYSAQ